MPNLRPLLTVTVLASLVVLGVNGVAVAATGHNLLLGGFNYANQPTRLTNTGTGPALRLNVKAGQAPLSVNRTTKVSNLNADLLDGVHSSALANQLYSYSLPVNAASGHATLTFPGLPAGRYLANYTITATSSDGATSADCAFRNATGYELANRASFTSVYAAVSGGGLVDTRSATERFECFFGGGTASWNQSQANYSSVTFLRVDAVSTPVSVTSALATRAARAHTAR